MKPKTTIAFWGYLLTVLAYGVGIALAMLVVGGLLVIGYIYGYTAYVIGG